MHISIKWWIFTKKDILDIINNSISTKTPIEDFKEFSQEVRKLRTETPIEYKDEPLSEKSK